MGSMGSMGSMGIMGIIGGVAHARLRRGELGGWRMQAFINACAAVRVYVRFLAFARVRSRMYTRKLVVCACVCVGEN